MCFYLCKMSGAFCADKINMVSVKPGIYKKVPFIIIPGHRAILFAKACKSFCLGVCQWNNPDHVFLAVICHEFSIIFFHNFYPLKKIFPYFYLIKLLMLQSSQPWKGQRKECPFSFCQLPECLKHPLYGIYSTNQK